MSEELGTQRRLLWFALAVFIPILVLTGLSVAAIRNDRVAYEYFQAKGQRDLLDAVESELDELLRVTRKGLFAKLQPTLAELDRGEVDGARLAQEAAGSSLIDGAFVLDARHELLAPRGPWPYDAGVRGSLPAGEATPEALRAAADRHRVEEQIGRLRRAEGMEAEARLAQLRILATDERPGSEPWGILSFAQAEEAEQAGQVARALTLYDSVSRCARVMLHDGRPLHLTAALRCARAEPAEEAVARLRAALEQMMEGRAGGISEAAFKSVWQQARGELRRRSGELGGDGQAFEARLEAFEAALRWRERLRDELGPALATLSADPSESGDWARRVAHIGEHPLLLCYRPLAMQGGQSSHIFLGFQLDLRSFAREVVAPGLARMAVGQGLAFTVEDSQGRILAEGGEDGLLRDNRLPTLGRRPEALPFWRIVVRRDPRAFESSAMMRSLVLLGIITLALIGVAFGVFATFRTVRQSLELARLKADFVSSVTHELKTPLTSIQMFAEMLSLGRVKTEEKRQQYYQHINSESLRLRGMIDDILEFARSEAGKVHYVLEEGDLADVAREALELFTLSAEAKGFEVATALPESGVEPPVDLDRESLARVFLNLLSNAVKYSTDDLRLAVRQERRGDELVVSVQDHGVGIERGNLEKVFDKFFREGDPNTREVSGTGLGLSLVDSIVKAHGGRVEVESEKGVGSTFSVILPIVEDYRERWPPPVAGAEEAAQAAAVNERGAE